MVSVAIGTAGAISAYFFGRAFSSHGLNESDPIKGLLLPLSYCLPVFGCGLVFWLLVLLWPKLRYTGGVASVHSGDEDKDPPQKDIAEVATLNAAITTVNLVGCLALASKQLPLLVHSLILFQLSSNLALLLIWASVSIRKYILSSSTLFTTKTDKRIVDIEEKIEKIGLQQLLQSKEKKGKRKGRILRKSDVEGAGVKGAVEAIAARSEMRQWLGDRFDDWFEYITWKSNLGSDPGYGREESGGGSGGDGGGGGGAEGRGDPEHGREESGGGSGGDGGGGGGSEGRGDPEHGREESGGGSGGDGGGGGGGEGRGDPEHGVIERKNESSFKVSKMSEMSIMLTAQTSAAVIGFHLTNPSFSTKVLFVLVMVDQLVGYLCGLTALLLQLQNQNPRAARVFANVGFACTGLGYILMTAMFLDWYLVLIAILSVGIFSIIFFRRLPRLIARLIQTYS